ncbi:MAG TPA: aminotransferase class V-fold PLP-dependent enzyme [Thermoanaerobaculia bacterium]|nr:aminotransferase class V-fold PLP-dependent enzyme [Thermoanaerobaculia bacterium]
MSSSRRGFVSSVGKGVGLAALSWSAVAALAEELQAAAQKVAALTPQQAATEEDFWFQIQQAFTPGRGITNLNNGGVCPSPRIVTEALHRYQWQQEEATAYTMWQILEPQSETVRAGLARLFGCDAEEIAITRNASESLETILMGIDLQRGDEILTTSQDYPRMLNTLRQREQREGIKLSLIQIPVVAEKPDEIVRAFEQAITPRTKMILVSHMVNITGQVLPVREICALARARNIPSVVDGAHSFAHIVHTRDDLGCDFYATSLHKWLYAPKGTGLLYARRDLIPTVWPLMAAEDRQAADIRKFEEIGTHSAAPRVAIGEAILFHDGVGAARKEARLRYLSRYWMNQVKSLPNVRFHTSFDDRSCAIATVEIEGLEPGAVTAHLMARYKIFTTPIGHEQFKGVRVTPNLFTTLSELDRFAEALTMIARNGLPA